MKTLLMLFVCVSATAALAQDFGSGLVPYQSFHGGEIDSVNLTTGNASLHIPIISYPERGSLKFDLALVSKQYWHPDANISMPSRPGLHVGQ